MPNAPRAGRAPPSASTSSPRTSTSCSAETGACRGTRELPNDTVVLDGKPERVVRVSGLSRLYTLIHGAKTRHGVLELRFTPGISGYAFTFG